MAATAVSYLSDGPVLSLINKRLRALRKKLNRITQMEDSLSQGKPLLKEQEDLLRSKPGVLALIDELDKLRQPLSSAVQEELTLALQHHNHHQLSVLSPTTDDGSVSDDIRVFKGDDEESETGEAVVKDESALAVVEDLMPLLYFGSLFDVKPQSEYTSTMLTRTHERGCCLTYDYVTDDATDLLGERDLDLISMLGSLLTSRPLNSSLSHKNALQRCLEHAQLWLSKSDLHIKPESPITYKALRERLDKIMASYYFTTTPEIKDPVEMAAAAGNFASFQMPVHGTTEPISVPVPEEGSVAQYQHKDEDTASFEGHESGNHLSIPVEEDELETENPADVSIEHEQVEPYIEVEQNQRDVESKEQQYSTQRNYPNQRGGRGANGGGGSGRRGYYNTRGGRGRGGGVFQNGRNQYYNQPGNYYPKNYYNNNRGRGGRGGQSYYNHGLAADANLVS